MEGRLKGIEKFMSGLSIGIYKRCQHFGGCLAP